MIYPSLPKTEPCHCSACHNAMIEHQGIFIVKRSDLDEYLSRYTPVQLRHNVRTATKKEYSSLNFGQSKGKTYNLVIIYPTEDMKKWLKDPRTSLADETRAKLYVAVTRARYYVAFVIPNDVCDGIKDIAIWSY